MKNKTRKQLIKEERYKLMKQAVEDGFYLHEIAKIFDKTEARVSQILNEKEKNK
jgi:hypothetical protein